MTRMGIERVILPGTMIEGSSVFQPVLETAKNRIDEYGKFLFCWERFLFRLKGIHRWEVDIDVLWLHLTPFSFDRFDRRWNRFRSLHHGSTNAS